MSKTKKHIMQRYISCKETSFFQSGGNTGFDKLNGRMRVTALVYIRGEVNNYLQCSCICVSVGSTVILRSIAMRGFLVIISAQV
jgi:hypothetical protein